MAKIYLTESEDGKTSYINVSSRTGDVLIAYFQDKKLFLRRLDDNGTRVVENFLETEDRYVKVGRG